MSLRVALVLAFVVVTTVVSAGLGLLGYLDHRERLRTKVEDDARRAVERLAESLRSPAWNFDQTQVRLLVWSELSASEHLAWISYDLGPRMREVCLRGDDGALRWLPLAEAPRAPDQQRRIKPMHRRDEDLGSVHLAVTRAPMARELARRQDEALLQTALLAVVMGLLAGVVVRRVLVRRLSALASLLAHAPEARIDGGAGDELSRLVAGSRALLGRLAAVLDAIGDGVVTVDRRGSLQRINPSAVRLLGEQGPERPLAEVLASLPGGRGLAGRVVEQVVGRGEPLALADPIQAGEPSGPRDLLLSAHPVREGDAVVGAVLVLRDVTVEVAARSRLLQAEKLESVGRMAGGIAHDFNNLLTVIVSSAELSLGCQDPARRQALTRNILTASAQAADFNRKLLAFARKDALHRTATDLRQVVEQAAGLLRHAGHGRMEVVTDLPPVPAVADVDRPALVNALINLGVNARDAMPGGGSFVIGLITRSAAVVPSGVLHGPLPEGPCAVITATDQGGGIPPEVMPRIFEPFFTTKPVGEGTGLGLAAVYGTVRSHQGAIAVASHPGRTVFTMLLPLSGGRPAEPADLPAADWRGSGRVLLVDDDELVRDLGRALLEEIGFSVATAVNGRDAVERFGADRGGFRLVLLDVMMPVMDGRAAAEAIRALDPVIPILFVTGYGGGLEPGQVDRTACGVVAKPYRLEDLRRAVRQALGH